MLNILTLIQTALQSNSSGKSEMALLKAMSLEEFINKFVSMLVGFAIDLAIAIFVFVVGKFIINRLYNFLLTIFIKKGVDQSLSSFVLSFTRIVLFFCLIVVVIGILGVETSSFIALFASAGVAVGMALSGTLQNFAGGVLILLLKPYRVGDYIEVGSYAGKVKEIQIFSTIITTADNKSILIPNGGLSTGSINNYSKEEFRRVDWTIGISYGDDVDTARRVILDLLLSDARVVKKYVEDMDGYCDSEECRQETLQMEALAEKKGLFSKLFGRKKSKPINAESIQHTNKTEKENKQLLQRIDRSPVVFVSALADSSVNLSVRAWTKNDDYWGVYFKMNELFYTTLPANGINFPFPQMDVHLDHIK